VGFTGALNKDPTAELAELCARPAGGYQVDPRTGGAASTPIDIVLAPAASEQWVPLAVSYVQRRLRRTARMGVNMVFMKTVAVNGDPDLPPDVGGWGLGGGGWDAQEGVGSVVGGMLRQLGDRLQPPSP
jgi:hypothetical protein